MSIEINLATKVALITGASQGIGAQIARTFHRAGALVALNHPDFGSTRQDAEVLATELNQVRPQSAIVLAANVADPAAVQAMMATLQQRLGGIDFLINNAAIIRDRTVAKMDLAEWNDVIGVNLSGVFHCCKYGLALMRDGGAIVSLGSIAAIQGFYGQANYAAAKAGVQAMMRVISRATRDPRQCDRSGRHRHDDGRHDSREYPGRNVEERPARPAWPDRGRRACRAIPLLAPRRLRQWSDH
jgi:3-oxoacyl-[acyl-carrier protein] reductase